MQNQINDEYDIITEIGTGGMATVYKAVQRSLDRMVAIKELKKSFHTDRQAVKRFERESRVAASLQHENIVHIYDYWKRPHYAIVMEYVDGTSLADVLEKTGALPVDVGIMIALQVSSALDYAHMRGLLHRDIKPSNIMIKRNGEVKLMDFGIAQARTDESLTTPGTLIGTPSYMSPEQVLGLPLDVRSDIFCFGLVLYEIFTGVKPFKDDKDNPATSRVVKDKCPSPRRENKEIPRRLQWLIKKCLRKKPDRRYRSILEVQKKLGKRLKGRTTKASSLHRIADYLVSRNLFEAEPEATLVMPAGKGAQSRRITFAVAGAASFAFAVVAGSGAYYYRTTHQPLEQPPIVPSAKQMTTGTTPTMFLDETMATATSPTVTAQTSPTPSTSVLDMTRQTDPSMTWKTTPTASIEHKLESEKQGLPEGGGPGNKKEPKQQLRQII